MESFTSILNISLALLTVVANLLSVGLLAALFSKKIRMSAFGRFFKEKSVLVAFAASLAATVGSLAYSDIIGYDPCKLCWIQRIFMYPQVLIMGIALIMRDSAAKIYGLWLSVIGGLIAFYHYIVQLGWNPLDLECGAVGYSASCVQTFVLRFGYITIPMMSLSAFILIALALILALKKEGDPVA